MLNYFETRVCRTLSIYSSKNLIKQVLWIKENKYTVVFLLLSIIVLIITVAIMWNVTGTEVLGECKDLCVRSDPIHPSLLSNIQSELYHFL
jgi:hypothetical protein